VPRLLAFVVLTCAAFAQDERRITSPNGQIEFRLFIAVQESNNLPRLAYEVFYKNQPLVKTSFMGLDIEVQEPLLGENVGLTSSTSAMSEKYNSLIAHYMQNGSLGRLIDVEARAYNDGVAFRYVIPPSTPLTELLIAEEATEFRLATPATITESRSRDYPPMHVDQSTMQARLAHSYKGTTPLTCPWRIIAIRPKSTIIADLNR
jgi:alpha-glucosidase